MIEYFGPNVARLRKLRGMTQAELAQEIGINKQTVSNIEKGSAYPSFQTLEKIYQVFHVPAVELFGSLTERRFCGMDERILDRLEEKEKLIHEAYRVVEYMNVLKCDPEERKRLADLATECPDLGDKENKRR